jgi:hypothetical protein
MRDETIICAKNCHKFETQYIVIIIIWRKKSEVDVNKTTFFRLYSLWLLRSKRFSFSIRDENIQSSHV